MEKTINFENYEKDSYLIGLSLAISSSLFIGASFIIKKISLLRIHNKFGYLRAGAGGFGYLKDWVWWLGLITMGVGELANFAAYTFAPASLVTPLGALSVLVSTILASKFLQEKLNGVGKIGCVLCILGSIIIIIHAPKEDEVDTLNELFDKLKYSNILNYFYIVIGLSLLIIFYIGPRYGNRYALVYIILCSLVGSITVMACKGLGLVIKQSLYENNSNELNKITTYGFFAIVLFCICIQMNYLNKALDLYNTSVVTPVYYVLFTTLVIVASAILYDEWGRMNYENILGSVCGFSIIIIAIFLLQNFKDLNVNHDIIKYNCNVKYLFRNNFSRAT